MNIVITAGGTRESIDAVRSIANMSTGKLGSIICNDIIRKWEEHGNIDNHKIFYICNDTSVMPTCSDVIVIIKTTDTASVQRAIHTVLRHHAIDYFVHSMAVSDYTVEGAYVYEHSQYGDMDITLEKIDTSSKLKSNNGEVYIKLVNTPKIIDSIKQIQPSLK